MFRLGMLGSIDANTGSPDLGWDTDQFPMDVKNATLIMKVCVCLHRTYDAGLARLFCSSVGCSGSRRVGSWGTQL